MGRDTVQMRGRNSISTLFCGAYTAKEAKFVAAEAVQKNDKAWIDKFCDIYCVDKDWLINGTEKETMTMCANLILTGAIVKTLQCNNSGDLGQ